MPIPPKTKLKMTVPPGLNRAQAHELLLKKVQAAHTDIKKIKPPTRVREHARALVSHLIEGNDYKAITEIANKAIELLRHAGIQASWEYPGFILVILPNGDWMIVGDVNGPWGMDILAVDGTNIVIEEPEVWSNLDQDPEAVSPEDLAAAIVTSYNIFSNPDDPHYADR